MTEIYPTPEIGPKTYNEHIIAQVKILMEDFDEEAIRIAAYLQSHVPAMHVEDGELTPNNTLDEQIVQRIVHHSR